MSITSTIQTTHLTTMLNLHYCNSPQLELLTSKYMPIYIFSKNETRDYHYYNYNDDIISPIMHNPLYIYIYLLERIQEVPTITAIYVMTTLYPHYIFYFRTPCQCTSLQYFQSPLCLVTHFLFNSLCPLFFLAFCQVTLDQ